MLRVSGFCFGFDGAVMSSGVNEAAERRIRAESNSVTNCLRIRFIEGIKWLSCSSNMKRELAIHVMSNNSLQI